MKVTKVSDEGGNCSHFFRLMHSTKFDRVNTLLTSQFRRSIPRTGQTWRGWVSVLVCQRHANRASLGALKTSLYEESCSRHTRIKWWWKSRERERETERDKETENGCERRRKRESGGRGGSGVYDSTERERALEGVCLCMISNERVTGWGRVTEESRWYAWSCTEKERE